MTIAQQIKSARKAKGIRQDSFADILGIADTYLSKVENGKKKPSLKLLLKIFSLLDISPEASHLDELGLTKILGLMNQKKSIVVNVSIKQKMSCPFCQEGTANLRSDKQGLFYFCCESPFTTTELDTLNVLLKDC